MIRHEDTVLAKCANLTEADRAPRYDTMIDAINAAAPSAYVFEEGERWRVSMSRPKRFEALRWIQVHGNGRFTVENVNGKCQSLTTEDLR